MASIIVVDDDPVICKTVENILVFDGHVVRTSIHPEEAIDMAHLFKADVLIADWNLKNHYDGFEVAMAIKEVREDIKTILITGYHEITDPPSGLSIFATLQKPFPAIEMSSMVDRALTGCWQKPR